MFAAAYSELPKTGSNSNTHQLRKGQILVHPYNKILLSNEKKKIMIYDICHNMAESKKHYA